MFDAKNTIRSREREILLPEMVVIVASHFCSCVLDWLPSLFSSLTILSTTLEVTITTSSISGGGGGGGGGGLNILLTKGKYYTHILRLYKTRCEMPNFSLPFLRH